MLSHSLLNPAVLQFEWCHIPSRQHTQWLLIPSGMHTFHSPSSLSLSIGIKMIWIKHFFDSGSYQFLQCFQLRRLLVSKIPWKTTFFDKLGFWNPEKKSRCFPSWCSGQEIVLTLKKAAVEPDSTQPYLMFVCLARSSADSIGDSIRSTVRKAARLAV